MTSTKSYTPEADAIAALIVEKQYGAVEQVTLWAGNFRRVEAELRKEIEELEKRLGSMLEEWETLAYRHLRDTANKEEIEYVLLQNMAPDEIDRRMKSIIKDIYPDPGFSPEPQSSPVEAPGAS